MGKGDRRGGEEEGVRGDGGGGRETVVERMKE